MYELCRRRDIPHWNTKKWIVAQDEQQLEACHKIHDFAQSIGVPTRFVGREEATHREPDVKADTGILESETTGIVDSHTLMTFLHGDFEDRGGDCAFQTSITRIEPLNGGSSGYKITAQSQDGSEDSITAETLINCGGNSACFINNMILPESRHRIPYYAKGTYFSYASSSPKPTTLVYPAPRPGYGGLGTHLTLDMTGRVRFGPDVEWVDDDTDLMPNYSRMEEAIREIRDYLPGIDPDAVDLDYCGIRPKLQKASSATVGKGFQDFIIQKEEGFPGFINLLGIESPGLTSSLAIGEMVRDLLYK